MAMVWWRLQQHPLTEDEREAEIARLIRKRDDMLARVPASYRFRRLLIPLMLAMFLYAIFSAC